MNTGVALREDRDGVLLPVCVKPRSRANAVMGTVTGTRGQSLVVSVQAPPVGGTANAAVIETLARALSQPKSSVSIERGGKSREKLVRLSGLSIADVRARLAALESQI